MSIKIEKILIAVDDLIFGAAITKFVTAHNWPAGSNFLVLHVVQPFLPAPPLFIEQSMADETEQSQVLVKQISTDMKAAFQQTYSVETKVECGLPKETILKVASDWQASMIIMGSHGRNGWDRFIMGSVSMAIMSHADCSLTVVRLPRSGSR